MRDDSTTDTCSTSPSRPRTNNLPVPASRATLRPNSDVDIIGCLGNAARAIEQVVMRQVTDDVAVLASNPEAKIKQAPDGVNPANGEDPIIGIFSQLVASFKNGESTEPIREDLTRLISGQEERADLLNNLLVLHDADRLPAYLKARRVIENYLLVCTERADLTAVEALAFLKIIQTEVEAITTRIRSGTTPVKDVEHLIEKADFVNKLDEAELARRFKATSPQGREILRKISYRLLKSTQGAGHGT